MKERLFELGLGLLIILVVIVITRIWVELKNARPADSPILHRSVALTIAAARQYHVDNGDGNQALDAWVRFVDAQAAQPPPTKPAHEFVDSFVICYQDGILDSSETLALYRQLLRFRPGSD